MDKELQECTNQLQEADKCNNEIQRELQDAIVIKKKVNNLLILMIFDICFDFSSRLF